MAIPVFQEEMVMSVGPDWEVKTVPVERGEEQEEQVLLDLLELRDPLDQLVPLENQVQMVEGWAYICKFNKSLMFQILQIMNPFMIPSDLLDGHYKANFILYFIFFGSFNLNLF